MKVSNGRCIRHLAWKSLQASRTRNLIAIAAIALTAVLFTSLFTIALSTTRASSRAISARWAASPTEGSSI